LCTNLLNLVNSRSNTSNLFSEERKSIKDVKKAKQKQRKDNVDYRRLKRFDVTTVSDYEKLTAPVKGDSSVLHCLCTTDSYIYYIIHILRYKQEGLGFDSRWSHWNFSMTKSFRSHCGSGVDSASNRNEYQESFLRVKTAGE
jgi:hypothetical protein